MEKWKDGQLVSTEVVIDVDEDDQVQLACAPAKLTRKAASTWRGLVEVCFSLLHGSTCQLDDLAAHGYARCTIETDP